MIRTETKDGKIVIELEGGHKEALEDIVHSYNFWGTTDAINFMLAVVYQAGGGIISANGIHYKPNDNLLNLIPKE